MRQRLDIPETQQRLRALLALDGPMRAPEICERLRISQPSFSRVVKQMPDVLRTGRARQTRYHRMRVVPGVPNSIPVYEIASTPDTRPRHLLSLRPVFPDGFWIEGHVASVESRFVDGLPWFLNDMRPAGFLGRLVPSQLDDPDLPADITRWTDDQTLRYLHTWGWNLPGSLIVGERALERFVAHVLSPSDVVPRTARHEAYPKLASTVLRVGVPGSSAAGEQPKFLATLQQNPDPDDSEYTPVIVKFSPPMRDALSTRVADLLICEHLALEVLRSHGSHGARSEIVVANARVFLEVERFDRVGLRHRRGLVSLLALDNQFVGRLESWRDTATELHAQGIVDDGSLRQICWLAVFGGLIANTDMHLGNLSLTMEGIVPTSPAPAYDMLPMLYAPRHQEVVDPPFAPPLPRPADAEVWQPAHAAAVAFWKAAASDTRISAGFRTIAAENRERVQRLSSAAALLPQ